jgi:Beta-lactamase enzyme family
VVGGLNTTGAVGIVGSVATVGTVGTVGEAGEVFPAHWVRRATAVPLQLPLQEPFQLTSVPPESTSEQANNEAERAEPDERSERADEAADPTSGVRLAAALRRSITVSSNEGANLLMQAVGLEAVNLVLLEAGCDHSVVERMVFDIAARDAGRTNRLTALDAAQLVWSIRFGTIAADDALSYLCEVLRAQTQRSMIAFALHDAIVRGEVVVGNKEGQTSEVLHDVAFIEPVDADPFVLAVCTNGLTEHEATVAVRKVAMYAYEQRFAWKSLEETFR